ncbi:Uncharacterized protein involved in exopolysaccharide biosynthesis [Roseivivax lentus]|uniref:Uncharacterized protein involved in exopolysaccharide biosynthesis n=1 Tax=Roseivivax lentus TaxID=633194 RepID=A0A1N7JW05_9RHOB|nr:hypothetical protein [Roseivivax lentus]SIS53513.1 Uncharacterized protein involved in exopolysaccharide biosynthesis [Roseivivax lentus]
MVQFQSREELFAAIRRRLPIMLLIVLIGCIAAVYVAMNKTKLYRATAAVQIESPRIPDADSGRRMSEESVRRIELIRQRMTSTMSLLQVSEEIGLFQPREPGGRMPSRDERLIVLRNAVSVRAESGNFAFSPTVAPFAIIIEVVWEEPEAAAALANGIMTAAIAESRARNLQRAQDALTFFDEEAAEIDSRIIAVEAEIAEFRRANDEALPGSIAALRSQLAALEVSEFEIDRQLAELQVNSDRLREADLARRTELLEDQKRLIVARETEIEAAIARAPEVARDLGVLERQLAALQEQYSIVVQQRGDAEFEQVMEVQDQSERLEILEQAVPPEYSFSRSRKSIAMLGALFSVIVALGAGYLLELFNPAIRSAAQLERQLGIKPVISVPVVQPRRTPFDRWGRRGGLLALILGGLALLAAGLGRFVDPNLWSRFLPRRAGS